MGKWRHVLLASVVLNMAVGILWAESRSMGKYPTDAEGDHDVDTVQSNKPYDIVSSSVLLPKTHIADDDGAQLEPRTRDSISPLILLQPREESEEHIQNFVQGLVRSKRNAEDDGDDPSSEEEESQENSSESEESGEEDAEEENKPVASALADDYDDDDELSSEEESQENSSESEESGEENAEEENKPVASALADDYDDDDDDELSSEEESQENSSESEESGEEDAEEENKPVASALADDYDDDDELSSEEESQENSSESEESGEEDADGLKTPVDSKIDDDNDGDSGKYYRRKAVEYDDDDDDDDDSNNKYYRRKRVDEDDGDDDYKNNQRKKKGRTNEGKSDVDGDNKHTCSVETKFCSCHGSKIRCVCKYGAEEVTLTGSMLIDYKEIEVKNCGEVIVTQPDSRLNLEKITFDTVYRLEIHKYVFSLQAPLESLIIRNVQHLIIPENLIETIESIGLIEFNNVKISTLKEHLLSLSSDVRIENVVITDSDIGIIESFAINLQFSGGNFMIIRSTIGHLDYAAIEVADVSDFVLYNSRFQSIATEAFRVNNADNVKVVGCVMENIPTHMLTHYHGAAQNFYFKHNIIREIEIDALWEFSAEKKIVFSHNRIYRAFPHSLTLNKKNETAKNTEIQVKNNLFQCDCNIQWIFDDWENTDIFETSKCFEPRSRAGRNFRNVKTLMKFEKLDALECPSSLQSGSESSTVIAPLRNRSTVFLTFLILSINRLKLFL